MFDTNVKGMLYLTRAILPYMIKKKNGHIINLGSVAGHTVYPGGAVYCASKFAVRALSEGLRMDLAGTNIRVSNIEPGMVNTEFSKVRLGDQAKADQVYAGMTPLSPQDIAETILWCLQRPAHVNIQELIIYPTDQAAVGQVTRRP
jgi:3-hydroxy acid dehydrogenase/malonic semialdehyde reductase